MSLEQNKLVARRLLEEVVNTGNVDLLPELVSPDCREANDPAGHSVGLDSMRAHVLGVRQTFSDLHLTVEHQIAEGDWVATRVTGRGTHSGVWLGMLPTGKQVEIIAVNLDRIVDGKIIEHGGAANMFEALLGIGAIKLVTH
ncbi:MAG: ester cyclase [Acidobacteria bacterium]|nr:ester cyclase [Acidobacteriota bacterium]